jgi:hypothetical protein
VRSDRKDDIDHYRHLTACFTCALKPKRTPDKLKRLKRWKHEGVMDQMQARLDRMPHAMGIRRQTVEHPFGTLKSWMGSAHFLTKTLEGPNGDEPPRPGPQPEENDPDPRRQTAHAGDPSLIATPATFDAPPQRRPFSHGLDPSRTFSRRDRPHASA